MPDLGVIALWFKVAYEFADFAFSAIVHYANTPEGAADWNDVLESLGSVGLVDTAVDGGSPSPENNSGSDASNGWSGVGQVRNAQEAEKAPHERLAAAPRVVRRATSQGVSEHG